MKVRVKIANAGTTSIQGLQIPEKENAARGDFEEEFEGWHEGLSAHENVVVTEKAKKKREKLVSDMEGYAGDPDFETKKENSMQDTYRVGTHNREDLVGRGKSSYGSKIDNSVCECPTCFGGKRMGLFACKNCKGEGVIRNMLVKKLTEHQVGFRGYREGSEIKFEGKNYEVIEVKKDRDGEKVFIVSESKGEGTVKKD